MNHLHLFIMLSVLPCWVGFGAESPSSVLLEPLDRIMPLAEYARLPEHGRIRLNCMKTGFPTAKHPLYLWLHVGSSQLALTFAATHPPGARRPTTVLPRDGAVYSEPDNVDLFICPDASWGRHYILGPSGAWYDSSVRVTSFEDGSGLKEDATWNGGAKVETLPLDNLWLGRMTIPVSDLFGADRPKPVRINLVRLNSMDNETLSLSPILSRLFQPLRFAELDVNPPGKFALPAPDGEGAFNFRVVRSGVYQHKESQERRFIVSSWFSGLFLETESAQHDKAFWLKELRRRGDGGICGPFLPWLLGSALNSVSESQLDVLAKENALRCVAFIEQSDVGKDAIARGAEAHPLREKDDSVKKVANVLHPKYTEAAVAELERQARRYQGRNWVAFYVGIDEPHNHQGAFWNRKLNGESPFYRETEAAIAKWLRQPDFRMPETITGVAGDARERAARAQAFRYWDKVFYEGRCRNNAALKAIEPSALYSPVDFNFIGGVPSADFSVYDRKCGDILACDPYASLIENCRGRGVYNHGFATKLLADLSGMRTLTIVQAFTYNAYSPTPEDVWEWASQAVKNGATVLDFFDEHVGVDDVLYRTELEIAQALKKLAPPEFPVPDCAIIDTFYERAGDGLCDGVHNLSPELYSAYVLVGERVGSWFKFISETQIERNAGLLNAFKVVYLPKGRCLTEKTAKALLAYVRRGGVLVAADPQAGMEPLYPEKRPSSLKQILPRKMFGAESRGKTPLAGRTASGQQVRWAPSVESADPELVRVVLRPPARSEILIQDEAGEPLVIRYRVGKGAVVAFGINPFRLSSTWSRNTNWDQFFKELQETFGCAVDEPIWSFAIPRPEE